jgi:CcmD family protein
MTTPPLARVRSLRRLAAAARALLGALAVHVLALAFAPVARAAEGGFKPYRPESAETVSAPVLVVLAYSAIFVVLVVFVISLFARQRRAEREIAELEGRLKRSE